jgi:hypothetical protein
MRGCELVALPLGIVNGLLTANCQCCEWNCLPFFKKIIAQKVYPARTKTSYKIVPLTNFNKYIRHDTSATEVNGNISANNGSEKLCKKYYDFQ